MKIILIQFPGIFGTIPGIFGKIILEIFEKIVPGIFEKIVPGIFEEIILGIFTIVGIFFCFPGIVWDLLMFCMVR